MHRPPCSRGCGPAGVSKHASPPVARGTRAGVRVPVAGAARAMARWGDEKTLFFIACYRDHECLWNPTSFFYKSKAARANAYASLLKQFNDDHLTVQLLKTKIKNIRTTYHQELNKIRYSRLSGAAQEYRPSLCWFDAVDAFLGATVHKEPLPKMIPQASRKFNNFKRKLLSSTKLDVNASPQADGGEPVQPSANEHEPPAKVQNIRFATNKFIRRVNDDDTDSEKSADTVNRVEPTSATTGAPGPIQDEFYFFGMNVAAQLRNLPLNSALQLQTEFQNSLYLARVHDWTSSAGDDQEDTTQTNDDVSDNESVDQDMDVKEFSLDVPNTVEVPVEAQPANTLKTFEEKLDAIKKGWDAAH
ncbi:hypothetical protein PYW07_004867 [Mythimna separata]|uniref:MADF domain-containing protein n=1 Tax=Mythimna separata TaxID=271217 RepID=A0AAD8DN73_MYTSE|nr:hypothetical protein PYW07_004867 [Mythimna separata]